MGIEPHNRIRITATAIVALLLCYAIPAMAQGSRKNRGFGDKLKLPSTVYEVSKVSKDGDEQKKLLRIFNIVRQANGGTLTKAEFVRRLKAREHFEVRYPDVCPTCNGWKRLIPRSGRRGADGKVTCRACRGSGVQMHPYLVKWKTGTLTHKGDKRDPILSSLIRQLGDHASAHEWFSAARSYHSGQLSTAPHAREAAHAAYEQAVAKANAAWRDDQPATSDLNRLHRRIIDESLEGIAATAPQRKKKPTPPAATSETPPTPERKTFPPIFEIDQTD